MADHLGPAPGKRSKSSKDEDNDDNLYSASFSRPKKSKEEILLNHELQDENVKNEIAKSFKTSVSYPTYGDENEDTTIRFYNKPFPCCVIPNFISNEDYVSDLKSELLNLEFHEKSNDLYKFSQSDDLKKSKSKLVKNMNKILYTDFLSWLRQVTGIDFNDTMDMSCAKYQYTDVLLCHDDELEGRRIAFIYYLVPPSWVAEDGGTLDMFTTDENGQPSCITRQLVPSYNSLVFFEVTPISFHQVSEVISESKCRLSISGWFHGPTVPRPESYVELPPELNLPMETDDDILLEWVNPMYLDIGIVDAIQSQLEEDSEIQLADFLIEEKYELIKSELLTSKLTWESKGPANKRNYSIFIKEDATIAPTLQSCFEFLHSKPLFKLLSRLTGLDLSHDDKDGQGDSDAPSSSSAFQNVPDKCSEPKCCGEIRKWSHDCYTLMYDNDPEGSEFALDAMLYFACEEWQTEFGGFTSYIANGEDEELLTVNPTANCLALVCRDKDTLRFVKHINSKCNSLNQITCDNTASVNRAQYFDISMVYFE